MFALILTTLLFFVRSDSADAGSSGRLRESCVNGFCITLNEGEITAEAGLCVVIPCSFYAPSFFTLQYMIWLKCDPYKRKCADSDIIFHSNETSPKVQSGFKGRVSLLEPNIDQRNCSIIISDLTESDSGSYQLRLNGVTYYGATDGFSFPVLTTLSVKVEHKGSGVTCKDTTTRNTTKEETLTPSVICPVQHYGLSSVVLPWTVAAVSLIVNVICVICMLKHWNTRHKVKPNDKDRTYMSLQRTDPSPEYDVIGSR